MTLLKNVILRFDSRRAPGSVIVYDINCNHTLALIAKVRTGPYAGLWCVVYFDDAKFAAIKEKIVAIPAGEYLAVKQAILDAVTLGATL